MDDVLQAMQVFGQDLEAFTARMAAAASALEHEHESLISISDTDPAYRQTWQDWNTDLAQYLTQDAPRIRSFLDDEIINVRRYLHG